MAERVLRTPPHNLEAEQALLGSIMLRPVAINDVADMVGGDDFYAEKHRIIFEAMLELHHKREPIDSLSVATKLKEKKQFDAIGGVNYLADLTSGVPSSTNVEYYAQMVGERSSLRKLIEAGSFITELAYEDGADLEDVMDRAEKHVFAATQSPKGHKFESIKEVLPGVWETMEKLHASPDEMRGVPSGFKGLDRKLNGFQRSDMIILAARPSMGKTSLALDLVRNSAVKHDVKVGFFSLEMSSQQLVDRMLSAEAQVDLWKLRTGKQLTEDDFSQIRDAMGRLSQAPIYIDDQAGNTLMRMRATARRLKAQHGLDLIVIDYLQLINTTRHYDSVVNQVSEISRQLKGIARELDVPVIALSQLSRAVEARGGKPRLSDLRDSGAIEQDADVVMFIHREKLEDGGGRHNHAEILIEKHRNGPTGVVNMYFDAEKTSFMDMDTNDYGTYGMEPQTSTHGGPQPTGPAEGGSFVGRTF